MGRQAKSISCLVLITILLWLPLGATLILSKSSIQMCENLGLSGDGDPMDVTSGTSCEKKMVVLMTVNNNQDGTEKLYATVSRVRDETTSEYARLYNPFMITLSKSPVYINYPYFYTGYSVNNQPFEEIKRVESRWYISDSSKSCYDQWQKTERNELKPTCGYEYTTKQVQQPDGSMTDVKTRIWDSQGFCCHCTLAEKDAYNQAEARNFKRAGLVCKFWTSSSQSAAHCMRMDPLWYTVHSFEESYRDFTIHVRAFDQIEKVVDNKTVLDYVNGGEIILSPSQRSGIGSYQRIIAHYVGDLAPNKATAVLSERYFLVPRASDKVDAMTHIQMKDGISKYLILPMSEVDLRGGACNKVGVSYSSFKNQAAGGTGFGCQQQEGYCLWNQPYHFWIEDQKRLDAGETPHYFPTRWGKLAGVQKKGNSSQLLLSYESDELHVSLVTLQISADDVILIYNRATGDIVRAGIKDFEAQSLNGKMSVEVRNTGYVTADFYVSVPSCTDGIHKIAEQSASINPQMTYTFTFSIKTIDSMASDYSCSVRLLDSKLTLLATRNVSFSTSAPCVCEGTSCKCECSEGGGVKCVTSEVKTVVVNVKLPPGKDLLSNIGGFFAKLASLPFKLFSSIFGGLFGWLGKIGTFLLIAGLVIGGIILVVCCLQCGFPSLICSALRKCKCRRGSGGSGLRSRFKGKLDKMKNSKAGKKVSAKVKKLKSSKAVKSLASKKNALSAKINKKVNTASAKLQGASGKLQAKIDKNVEKIKGSRLAQKAQGKVERVKESKIGGKFFEKLDKTGRALESKAEIATAKVDRTMRDLQATVTGKDPNISAKLDRKAEKFQDGKKHKAYSDKDKIHDASKKSQRDEKHADGPPQGLPCSEPVSKDFTGTSPMKKLESSAICANSDAMGTVLAKNAGTADLKTELTALNAPLTDSKQVKAKTLNPGSDRQASSNVAEVSSHRTSLPVSRPCESPKGSLPSSLLSAPSCQTRPSSMPVYPSAPVHPSAVSLDNEKPASRLSERAYDNATIPPSVSENPRLKSSKKSKNSSSNSGEPTVGSGDGSPVPLGPSLTEHTQTTGAPARNVAQCPTSHTDRLEAPRSAIKKNRGDNSLLSSNDPEKNSIPASGNPDRHEPRSRSENPGKPESTPNGGLLPGPREPDLARESAPRGRSSSRVVDSSFSPKKTQFPSSNNSSRVLQGTARHKSEQPSAFDRTAMAPINESSSGSFSPSPQQHGQPSPVTASLLSLSNRSDEEADDAFVGNTGVACYAEDESSQIDELKVELSNSTSDSHAPLSDDASSQYGHDCISTVSSEEATSDASDGQDESLDLCPSSVPHVPTRLSDCRLPDSPAFSPTSEIGSVSSMGSDKQPSNGRLMVALPGKHLDVEAQVPTGPPGSGAAFPKLQPLNRSIAASSGNGNQIRQEAQPSQDCKASLKGSQLPVSVTKDLTTAKDPRETVFRGSVPSQTAGIRVMPAGAPNQLPQQDDAKNQKRIQQQALDSQTPYVPIEPFPLPLSVAKDKPEPREPMPSTSRGLNPSPTDSSRFASSSAPNHLPATDNSKSQKLIPQRGVLSQPSKQSIKSAQTARDPMLSTSKQLQPSQADSPPVMPSHAPNQLQPPDITKEKQMHQQSVLSQSIKGPVKTSQLPVAKDIQTTKEPMLPSARGSPPVPTDTVRDMSLSAKRQVEPPQPDSFKKYQQVQQQALASESPKIPLKSSQIPVSVANNTEEGKEPVQCDFRGLQPSQADAARAISSDAPHEIPPPENNKGKQQMHHQSVLSQSAKAPAKISQSPVSEAKDIQTTKPMLSYSRGPPPAQMHTVRVMSSGDQVASPQPDSSKIQQPMQQQVLASPTPKALLKPSQLPGSAPNNVPTLKEPMVSTSRASKPLQGDAVCVASLGNPSKGKASAQLPGDQEASAYRRPLKAQGVIANGVRPE